MFDHPSFANHEQLVHVHDDASGLNAIIALHSTALGPAAGGCRLRVYDSLTEAEADVLRLSQAMSYKNAMAGLPLGGGKAVILGPIAPNDRPAVFEAFGRAVERLNGAYITAQDLGVSLEDLASTRRFTRHVQGAADAQASNGDPSPYTARGVLLALKAAAEHTFGSSALEGKRILVQGIGGVGANLARLLAAEGAALLVSDIQAANTAALGREIGATVVPFEDCLLERVDILAPCAIGGILTEEVAQAIEAKAVAGGANNQLANVAAGEILHQRGILYAPDYVANAGGIMAVEAAYSGQRDTAQLLQRIDAIGPRMSMLLRDALAQDVPPGVLADQTAQQIIDSARAEQTAKVA